MTQRASGTVAVIGELERVRGFALAGVPVVAAADGEQARAAWRALPDEVAVVFLTRAAHDALADGELAAAPERLWVVMPG